MSLYFAAKELSHSFSAPLKALLTTILNEKNLDIHSSVGGSLAEH